MKINCDNCGAEMERALNKATRGKHNFCSRKCNAEHQTGKTVSAEIRTKAAARATGVRHTEETKKKLSIQQAGRKRSKETLLKMSTSHKGIGKGKKLSAEHRAALSGKRKRGKLSGRWKGGKASERTKRLRPRTSAKYKDWRTTVFIQDDFTCQRCGQKGGQIRAHHIKPWGKYPKGRYDIDNGVTLCKACHKFIHAVNGHKITRRAKEIGQEVMSLNLQKRKAA